MKLAMLIALLTCVQSQAQSRLIPHLTRSDGGFESRLLIHNPTTQSQSITLEAHDQLGNSLTAINLEIAASQTLERDPQMLWNEPASLNITGSETVQVIVSYQNSAGTGSPSHLNEVRQTSKGWQLYSGNWDRVFDGVALVNTGNQATSIRILQVNYQGQTLDEHQLMANLPPQGKALYVLGGPNQGDFVPRTNVFYRIQADQPLALTALRGDLPANTYLWANQAQVWTPSSATGPDFTIQSVPTGIPAAFGATFDKYMDVFGVRLFATSNVTTQNFTHAGHVMAQYLDNNEDGIPDDAAVVTAMQQNNASMVMFGSESDPKYQSFLSQFNDFDTWKLQDLRNDETFPNGRAQGRFDATLEEVLHLISNYGYAPVYPDVFGTIPGTSIALAMDTARGGFFTTIPSSYPANAWYTYNDATCNYECQISEYIYWALTSILGGQDFPGRGAEISNEWRLNSRAQVESGDPAVFSLLTNPQYKLPTTLPDGSYGN